MKQLSIYDQNENLMHLNDIVDLWPFTLFLNLIKALDRLTGITSYEGNS